LNADYHDRHDFSGWLLYFDIMTHHENHDDLRSMPLGTLIVMIFMIFPDAYHTKKIMTHHEDHDDLRSPPWFVSARTI
jgi:hypothetical protein